MTLWSRGVGAFIDLQNVFVYVDEFNAEVYTWDLVSAALGMVNVALLHCQIAHFNRIDGRFNRGTIQAT